MRAATERCRPPAPPTTTRSPTDTRARLADRQRRQVEPRQRLDQAEAGRLVVGQHGAGHARPSISVSQIVSASVTR